MTSEYTTSRLGPVSKNELDYSVGLLMTPDFWSKRLYIDGADLCQWFAELHYWRILPYGIWTTKSDDLVVFDREYCPLLKVSPSGVRGLASPLERIEVGAVRHLYEEATSPIFRFDTLPKIAFLAAGLGLQHEIEYRWQLSDYGRKDHRDWGQKWTAG